MCKSLVHKVFAFVLSAHPHIGAYPDGLVIFEDI